METSRNYSLTIAFLLAFLIIASDMHMVSQARKMTDELDSPRCNKDADCHDSYCLPPLVEVCVAGVCMCIHFRSTSTSKIP
ncbi:unnamed protein product [Trifolium pratense]|uniref:Uncharacterized protein n=1 Tax=Trifolium pratense TaxID=57577 RepID=A0ACB0KAF1_TRIPR|nr:unnamed protein product [Trifolium pratense]